MVKPASKKVATPDIELDEYEASDSDDDYDENEKVMLEKAGKRRSKIYDDDDDSEEEVFGIHESEEDEDEPASEMEPLGEEMDSDIDGKADDDDLPDSKAWGSNRKNYYSTDYTDGDYGGFSKAEEEEDAMLEEQEAREIQNRLIAELEDADISMGLFPTKSPAEKEKGPTVERDELSEIIKTDVSKLNKREKLALLEKEAPEFSGLISDFKDRMSYARDNLEPILALVKCGEIPNCDAAKFVSTKYHTILNYCTNIAFYLLLKSKRVKVASHPVIKRLVQFRKFLEEMDPIDEEIIQPQVKEILKLKKKGKELVVTVSSKPTVPVLIGNRKERRRKLQQIKDEESGVKKPKVESFEEIQQHKDNDESIKEEVIDDTSEKRAITYEIAKNKGLTPQRKRENRNPRVKYRNKFKKAVVRRKGQVRGVYTEKKRYDGEPFGIKMSVSKSIKLK